MSNKGPVPGIPKYLNDGKGRDTYISFFNGGFSNYPYSNSYKKDFYEISHKGYHADLYMRRPIVKYNMDGNGRDYFIHQNILSEHCKLKDSSDFPHMLRNGREFAPIRINKSFGRSKFEKNLINRIFYGKCPGVNDRLMMPKVKFNKKEKNTDLKYNLTNPCFNTNEVIKEMNDLKKDYNMNNTYNNKSNYNVYNTDNNYNFKSKNNKKAFSVDKKRKFIKRNYVGDLKENEFIESVKSLYLFNHKKNKAKELDLPILI